MPRTVIDFLTPENSFIFRITHVENVPWILDHGLHCRSSDVVDSNFIEIGNQELIGKRAHRPIPFPPGGTLNDYVPFYFTPCTPMLYNIKTGYNGIRQRPMSEIALFVSSLKKLEELNLSFVFTDRHAYLEAARFSSDLANLDRIDWVRLRNRDFRKNPDDPEPFERYQAEALVHRRLPVEALVKLGCNSHPQKKTLDAEIGKRGLTLEASIRPEWYP